MEFIRVIFGKRIAIHIFGAKKKSGYIMENWLEKANEKFLGYDPNIWVREFFDPKTGGYVVVNRDRWVKAVKYKNESGKYKDEFAVARMFASNGYAMEMLKEVSGDTRIYTF